MPPMSRDVAQRISRVDMKYMKELETEFLDSVFREESENHIIKIEK